MAVGGRARLAEEFLPSTFEERGIAVPFTTAILAYSRARKSARGFIELCVTRFADAAGYYVIPWNAVRDIASLTVHDYALHEEVITARALDPHAMRLAALRVAADGLAGEAAADAAIAVLAADDELKALNQVLLMMRVLQEIDPVAAPLLFRGISRPEGQARVRAALFGAADRLELKPEIFDYRLSQLGINTYTVGVPWSPTEGRLRRILRRLGELVQSLVLWARIRVSDAAHTARFCASVASLTHTIGTGLLSELDELLADPRSIVISWDQLKEQVEQRCTRLAWLLDGWDPICQWWFDGENQSVDDQAVILQDILPVLPIVPRDELEGAKRFTVGDLVQRSRRFVRLHEDWLTGDLVDVDMVDRMEQLKIGWI
jgi:hypothetical protein